MANIDLNGDGRAYLSISVPQIVTLLAMFASIVGSYYTLSNRISLLEDEVAKLNYNQKEYTWKSQRQLEADFRTMELEVKGFMKDLEYLQKDKRK
jgi:hypothetical protein